MRFVGRLRIDRKIPLDRYAFEKQETEARVERDVYHKGEKFGEVMAVDVAKRTVDIKKTRKMAEVHPQAVYLWDRPFEVKEHAEALYRIGSWVEENGLTAEGRYRPARDLMLRKGPHLLRGETIAPLPGEEPKATACRIATALDEAVFAIQGPLSLR